MKFLPLFFLLVSTASAQLPVAELKRDKPVDFATEVYPFLKANCLACHNSTKAKADLILESPQHMIEGGETGPAVNPGDGENSFLFTTAAHIEEPTMPPKNNKSKAKNLTPDQLALLRQWIDEGAEGDTVSTAAPESWSFLSGPQPILTSALTEDGRFAAVGRGQRIDLYDLRLGKMLTSLRDPSIKLPTAHNDAVQSLAFRPDGTLASGGYRSVKLWNRANATAGDPIDLPDEPVSMAVSPDGKTTAIGTKNGSIVLVTGGKANTVKTHTGAVGDLAFSADGKILFSVAADKTVQRRSPGAAANAIKLELPAEALSLALVNNDAQVVLGCSDHTILLCQADLKSPITIPPPAPKPTPAPEEKKTEVKPAPALAKPKPETPKPAAPIPAKPKPAPAKPATKPTPPVAKKPEAVKPAAPTAKKPEAAKTATPAPAKPKPEMAKQAPAPATTPKSAPPKSAAPKPAAPAPVPPTPAAPKAAPPKPAAPKPAAPKPKTITTFKFHAHPVVAMEPANAAGTEFLAAHADGTVIHLKLDPANPAAVPTQIRRIIHGGTIDQIEVANDFSKIVTGGPTGSINLWKLSDGTKLAELKGDPRTPAKLAALKREVDVANRIKAHWEKKAPEAETLWKAELAKVEQSAEAIAKAKRELVVKRSDLQKLEEKQPPATDKELETAREAFVTAERGLTGAIRNRESSTRLAGEAFGSEAAAKSAASEAAALSTAIAVESTTLQKAESEAAAKIVTTAIAFSADGSELLQSMKEGGIRVWSAADGVWLEDVPTATNALAISANPENGVTVATNDKKLTQWTLPGSQWTLTKALGNGSDPEPFEDRVGALAFSPHGEYLVTGTGVPSRSGRIAVWNTDTWEEVVRNDEAHEDTITAFSFSPDGNRVASASTDKLIKIRDTATLEVEQTLEGHTAHVLDIDWNADDLVLASSGADRQIKVWDLAEGQQSSKVEGYEKEVTSIEYIGDGIGILTASGDETLKYANQPLPGAKSFLHTAAANADGMVLIAGGEDGVLRVWDRAARKLVREFPQPESPAPKIAAE